MTAPTLDQFRIVDDICMADRFTVRLRDARLGTISDADRDAASAELHDLWACDERLALVHFRYALSARRLRMWFYETESRTVHRSLIANARRMDAFVEGHTRCGESETYCGVTLESARVVGMSGNATSASRPMVIIVEFPIRKSFTVPTMRVHLPGGHAATFRG